MPLSSGLISRGTILGFINKICGKGNGKPVAGLLFPFLLVDGGALLGAWLWSVAALLSVAVAVHEQVKGVFEFVGALDAELFVQRGVSLDGLVDAVLAKVNTCLGDVAF